MNEVLRGLYIRNTVLSLPPKPSDRTTQSVIPPHWPLPQAFLSLPAQGDDWSVVRCVPGGKLTLGPGDVGHQEDVGEWQGGHGGGYPKDHGGRPFIDIHPVSGLSDLEISPGCLGQRSRRQEREDAGARKQPSSPVRARSPRASPLCRHAGPG